MKNISENRATNLKTALIFTMPALLLSLSLSACGGKSGSTVPVSKSPASRKGSNTDSGQGSEKTGPMGSPERQLAPIIALMRIERSVGIAFAPPVDKNETFGCASLTGLQGNGIFVIAHYEECPWMTTSSVAKNSQLYSLTGDETFERLTDKPTTCSVTGDSYLTASTSQTINLPKSSKSKSGATINKYLQFICLANHAGGAKTGEANAAWGNSSNSKVAYWNVQLKNANWNQLSDDSVVLNSGAELTWKYAPASATKTPSAEFYTILKITSTVSFANFADQCPWPVSGSAQITEIDQNKTGRSSLTFTFSQTGYRTSDGKTSNWPTDHCAGAR